MAMPAYGPTFMTKLKEPQRTPRRFSVHIQFAGNWETETITAQPVGMTSYNTEQYRYLYGESGPKIEGSVSLGAAGETPGEAVAEAIAILEKHECYYTGFLEDASEYSITVESVVN